MFNSLRQGARVLAVLAPFRAGGTALVLVIALLVLVVIVAVVWTCIWSGNQQRRKDALKVLDRLLRWKGR